jgi:O-antigen ligase
MWILPLAHSKLTAMKRSLSGITGNVLVALYGLIAMVFAMGVASLAWQKGMVPFTIYVICIIALSIIHFVLPRALFLSTLLLMPFIGWTSTGLPGFNLSLMGGLLCYVAALFCFKLLAAEDKRLSTVEILTLGFSLLTALSCGFALLRLDSFTLLKSSGYTNYSFNPLNINSADVLHHVLSISATLFSWFGLLVGARKQWQNRWLPAVLLVIPVGTLAVMMYQRFVDPFFLLPLGFRAEFRLNGATSYAYALGALLVLLLALAPRFFSKERRAMLLGFGLALIPIVLWSGSRLALLIYPLFILVYAGSWLASMMLTKSRLPWNKIILSAAGVLAVCVALLIVVQATTSDGSNSALDRLLKHTGKEGWLGHFERTRLNAYPIAFAVIEEYPLAGVGLGTYYAEISKQVPLLLPEDFTITDKFNHRSNAPNLYLAIASDMGLPALGCFLAIWLVAVYQSFNRIRKEGLNVENLALLAALLVVLLAFHIGPELYNGEVACLAMLLVAANSRRPESRETKVLDNRVAKTIVFLLVLATAVGISFSYEDLSVDNQWEELQWHVDKGFYPFEESGRWSSDFATVVIQRTAPLVRLRWHVGNRQTPDYAPTVSFLVDGVEISTVENVVSGNTHTTVLPLHDKLDSEFYAISVQVSPPLIPTKDEVSDDTRSLGIFLHGIEPAHAYTVLDGWKTEQRGGRTFNWMDESVLIGTDGNRNRLTLAIKSGHPDLRTKPARISIFIDENLYEEVDIRYPAEWENLFIPLTPGKMQIVRLEADRIYIPSEHRGNNDRRKLSFMVAVIEPEDKE